MNSTAKTVLISFVAILGIALLWYNFGPLPEKWTPAYREQQAKIHATTDTLNAKSSPNQELLKLEYESAMKENGAPFKARIDAIIAKYKAKQSSDPATMEKDLTDFEAETKVVEDEGLKSFREFDSKWRKDHPSFR